MSVILVGRDAMLARWAASRIPHIGSPEEFGECAAVGVATGEGPDDRLMAVVIYHDIAPQFERCQISAASADPRWASRGTLRAVLAVPFLEYGLHRVWTMIPESADRALRFVRAIGFTREASLKDHFGKGQNAVICRMLMRDYERKYFGERPEMKKAA